MSVTKSCSAALTVGFALAPALSHGQSITQTPTTLYSLENNPANLADGAVPLTPPLEHQSSLSTLSLFFGNVSTINASPFNGGVYSMPITGTAASTLSAGCSWGAGTPMGDALEVPTSLGDVLVMAIGRVPNAGVNNNHNDPGDYGELIACNESSGGSSATVLYRFLSIGTGTAGGVPSGSMVAVYGSGVSGSGLGLLNAIYGTTRLGGQYGYGAIYRFVPSSSGTGTVVPVYSFTGGSDGGEPIGGLTSNSVTLYGTTFEGGSSGFGTIFECTLSSATGSTCTFSSLHTFTGLTDGMGPTSPLAFHSHSGTRHLYGTTSNWGTSGGGTLFDFNLSTPAFSTLYSFPSSGQTLTPGSNPFGDIFVTSAGGTISVEGTTWQGGSISGTTVSTAFGTIYRWTSTMGSLTTVYTFLGGPQESSSGTTTIGVVGFDGAYPLGGLSSGSLSTGSGAMTYLFGATAVGGCGNGVTNSQAIGTCTATSAAGSATMGSGTIFDLTFP